MKKWYQSRTIWVNIVALTLASISLFDAQILNIFGFEENVTVKLLTVIGLINSFLNIVLRFLTTGEILKSEQTANP